MWLMTMNCRSNRDDAMYSLPRKGEEKIDLHYRVMSQSCNTKVERGHFYCGLTKKYQIIDNDGHICYIANRF